MPASNFSSPQPVLLSLVRIVLYLKHRDDLSRGFWFPMATRWWLVLQHHCLATASSLGSILQHSTLFLGPIPEKASLSPDIARCLWACDCPLFPPSLEGTSPGSTSQTAQGCILHSSYLNTRLVYSPSPGLRIVLAGSLAAVNHKGRCCIWFLPYTCPSRAHATATAGGSRCCLHPQTKVLMPPVLIYCSQIQHHLNLISFPTYLPALFFPSQCTGGKTPHLLAAKAMHATSPVEVAEETTLAGLSPILPADSSFLIFPVE